MHNVTRRTPAVRSIGLCLLLVLAAAWAGTAAQPEYVVIIVIDGFRNDYMELYDTPNLHELAKEGVRFEAATGVFPSNSTVNQTSLVTGAYPETTGIPNNSRYDRNADRIIEPLRDNRAVTVARAFRDAGLRTASVSHYMLERDVDLYSRNLGEGLLWLRGNSPPNLFVYLNLAVDEAGHGGGPFSARTAEAVAQADAEVGIILDTLRARGIYDKTVIVVVSDHGMSPADGQPIRPTLEYQMWAHGFTVAKDNAAIRADTDIVQIQHGSAFLYLRDGRFDTQREEELLAALRQIVGAVVYDREALRELHTDPDLVGDIVVAPAAGYTLYPGRANSGIHGRPAESQIALILSGPGIRKGVTLGEAEIVDVVPTLLALFDLPLPATVDGRVLTEALEPSS